MHAINLREAHTLQRNDDHTIAVLTKHPSLTNV